MTQAQKIIKYLAICFAIFLIVTIASAILSGIYGIVSSLGLVNQNENVITEDLKVISNEIAEISTLKIDLGFTNLHIKPGKKFKVETNNSNISYEENNGRVVINEKTFKWLSFKHNTESSLIVYLPENMIALDEIKIEGGAGTINIDSLETRKLYLGVGAGAVKIENVKVYKELKLDGGAGQTELENTEVNNLDANLGVGEFSYNGILKGNTDIDSGIGNIRIDLTDDIKNYTIDIDKGLGNVTLNGKNIETNRVHGTGKNHIEIDGGIGNININYENVGKEE